MIAENNDKASGDPPPRVTMVNGDRWTVDRRGLCWPRPGRLLAPPPDDQVDLAMQWLQLRIGDAGRIATPTLSSYRLKHASESWAGQYIANGAMIIALHRLDFPMRMARSRGPRINAMAAISWGWYRRLPESQMVEPMETGVMQ